MVAATFLLSLASARPVVARLAGDFYPMDAELSLRPRVRRLFWRLTAMWAVVCLAKAVAMFWALNSLSLDTFVLVKSITMPASNLLAVGRHRRRRRAGGPQGGADRAGGPLPVGA